MKIAIIGAGIVGLSLAKQLLCSDKIVKIDLYDSFSIPSKGTSIRNSGVLHAGLYYAPGSFKSKLCFEGRTALERYITENSLPLLRCGKLLVPHTESDKKRLYAIKQKADANGCDTYLVDYDFAKNIQPGICIRSIYLWSPKTGVFYPKTILNQLVADLVKTRRVSFVRAEVDHVDPCTTSIKTSFSSKNQYDYIYNVAGPGALKLFKQISNLLDNIKLIPFIGEYARLRVGPDIKTNIYPVPDPNLPFLGVHVTPRANEEEPIIGPNALPFQRSYLDEYISSDITDLGSRLALLSAMFMANKENFRDHAISEFAWNKKKKFLKETKKFFDEKNRDSVSIELDMSVYGIRPQLLDIKNLKFVNDFVIEKTNNVIHVVNAVSPAFTSALSLGDYLCKMI